MNLERFCERCDTAKTEWTVRQWTIEVGRILRKPMLCEDCTRQLEAAIRAALTPARSRAGR